MQSINPSESFETYSTTTLPKPIESEILLGEGGPTERGWHKFEAMLRCSKEYQFAKVRKIGLPQAQTPDAFAVGGLFHAARASWFASNFTASLDSLKEVLATEATKWNLPISLEAEQRALSLVDAYMRYYSVRPPPKPVAAEYLVGPTELVQGIADSVMTARLDDVSRYPEAGMQLCIGESKTTSESISGCISQYTLHGQPLVQAALWKLSPQGEAMHGPIAGVLLDVVKKGYGKNKPEFARQLIPITEYQLSWYVEAMAGYLADASAIQWNSKHVQRNLHSCTRLISGRRVACQYRELCMYGRSAAGKYALEDGTPLAAWKPSEGKEMEPWK